MEGKEKVSARFGKNHDVYKDELVDRKQTGVKYFTAEDLDGFRKSPDSPTGAMLKAAEGLFQRKAERARVALYKEHAPTFIFECEHMALRFEFDYAHDYEDRTERRKADAASFGMAGLMG